MNQDIEHLIRSAKPIVPAGARARTLESVEPEGAVGSTPAFVRVFLRVAALVLLAVCSGIVAAMLSAPAQSAGEPVDVAAQIADARARLDSLEQTSLTNRIANLQSELSALQAERNSVFERVIKEAIVEHEQQQMAEWRERHIRHVREHQAVEREATIRRMRDELDLTPEQEKEVRALLVSTDKQAEALISGFYTDRHARHDPSMHEKFEKLAEEADTKLTALLDAQQRDQMNEPTGIVSAEPEDWAPSFEFRDGTDVDVYTNWITVTRE
ncbi:MAG: hypothetical protein KDB68_14880 [Planctomycetes bacterium]|nr:hypothetical protein [Planctomycetota bacterium]